MIFYSATQRGFYDNGIHRYLFSKKGEPIGKISDAVPVSTEEHRRLLTGNGAGQVITPDESGYPILTEPVISDETKWEQIRIERNALLDESDYTQMSDYNLNTKIEWAEYRQTLRDITDVFHNPGDMVWPMSPK